MKVSLPPLFQPMPNFIRSIRASRLLLAFLLAGGSSALASTLTWDGGDAAPNTTFGGSGTWNTTSLNWTSGGLETPWTDTTGTDTALFLGTAGTVTLGETVTANSLFFGVTGYVLNGATLNLAGGAPAIHTDGSTVSATINSVISDTAAAGLTKTGAGSLILGSANTYSGLTDILAGTVKIDANTGSLSTGSGLTFGSATRFGGTGTFNYDNTTSSGGRAQTLGALTFRSGDGTVQSTRTAAQNVGLTFASYNSRSAGATGTFLVAGGTNGTSNLIALTGQATGFFDQGTFFSTGTSASTNFAFYDAGGFVRGIDYTADTGAATIGAGSALPTTGVGGGAALYVRNTGAISNQGSQTITSLNISGANNVTQAAATTLTVNGILKTGGNAATISGGTINSAGSNDLVIYTGSGDTLTISSTISNGSNNLVKSGAGVLSLTVANSYAGTTYLSGGTINNGGISISGATGTGSLVINGGTIAQSSGTGGRNFTLSNSSQIWAGNFSAASGSSSNLLTFSASTITLTGDRVVTTSGSMSASAFFNVTGAIGDGGNGYGLSWAGAGGNRVVLGSSSSYSGVTTILGGHILFTGNVASGANSAFGNSTTDILVGATSGTANVGLLANNATVSFSRNIVVQSGGTGGVVIGTILNSSAGGGSFNDSGTITLGSGGTGRNVTLHRGSFSGNIMDPAGLTGTPGSVVISSVGATNGNTDASFTTALSGDNTFSGGVTLTNNTASTTATLAINSATALGTGTLTIAVPGAGSVAINNSSAADITLTNNNAQVWNNSFTFTGTHSLNMGTGAVVLSNAASAVTVTVTANTLTIGGVIANGSVGDAITKAGNGTLKFGGANTYTGDTTVSAGTLNLANTNALQNSTLASGAVVFDSAVASHAFIFGGLKGGTNLVLQDNAGAPNAVALSVGKNNQSTTYSGSLSGAGSVTKIGTGTLILSAAQSYTGITTVSEGTLTVNGSLAAAGAVSVESGGTLSGSGSVGQLTVKNGATLSPGNSPGLLTADSAILQGGGKFKLELNLASSPAPGTNNDLLTVTNALDLSGLSSGTPFVIELLTLDNGNVAAALADFNDSLNYSWTFATASSITNPIGGFDSSLFSVNTAGFANSFTGSFQVREVGNTLSLNYVPVPEPGACVVAFAALGMLILTRRGHRRSA